MGQTRTARYQAIAKASPSLRIWCAMFLLSQRCVYNWANVTGLRFGWALIPPFREYTNTHYDAIAFDTGRKPVYHVGVFRVRNSSPAADILEADRNDWLQALCRRISVA